MSRYDENDETWSCGICGKVLPVTVTRCPEVHPGPDYE
jgi:hypothetical protein